MKIKIQLPGLLLVVCMSLTVFATSAQIRLEGYNQEDIDARLFSGRWKASWITMPNEPEKLYGVYHFRKTFALSDVPGQFIVHVSADNRYKLYVNGRFVSLGPAYGDALNWNFETLDIAPYLKAGNNTVAAVVWNFAAERPLASMGLGMTGFILQGNTTTEDIINTDSSWLCARSKAYEPFRKPVLGYYAAGACEKLDASGYLWGWERPGYDDAQWTVARPIIEGAMKGSRDYPGWQLVPRPIPQMEMEPVRIPELRKADGVKVPAGFPAEAASFTIPANSEVELLLDNRRLMTGYLTLGFSGGKGAEVEISYAESLYEAPPAPNKGKRNETEGKHFVGYADKVIADGGSGREYTPLWWRTWRYVRLAVKTQAEPLVIDDVRATSSMYPFVRESAFNATGHRYFDDMLETGWWTARLCANETYMDCPYYEQLQYFGDTRIQALITMFNTRNDEMVRNALEQGRQSVVPDGITMSRYPSHVHQFIPSYSLWWICMGHDYWMYRGDEEYVKTLLPACRSILSWYEERLKPDLSLDRIPFWFFVDWSQGMIHGEPDREPGGDSSIQDLHLIIALQAASEMERSFGSAVLAAHYGELADGMKAAFHKKYWSEGRGLYADTQNRSSFSQHANILAIIAGITKGKEASSLLDRLMSDKDLIQCTIYFRYYLHQAMKAAGRSELLLDNLDIWKDQLALGLTTWAEMPEPSRSDCHAWGSSLNIEFFRMILGIDSDAPGFARVRIEPALGELKEVSGSIPHPLGMISAKYSVSRKGELTAEISLPKGVNGIFVWKGVEYGLTEGTQIINIQANRS